MMRKSFSQRFISLVLALTILFGILPLQSIALYAAESDVTPATPPTVTTTDDPACADVTVLYNGAQHRVITVDEGGREIVELFTVGGEPTKISWQILTPTSNKWINIYGANSDELGISYALVGSMLNDDGSAFIRASVKHADHDKCISEPVEVKISYDASDKESAESTSPASYAIKRSAVSAASALPTTMRTRHLPKRSAVNR